MKNHHPLAAFIISTIGFLLVLGTVGQAEFDGILAEEFYIRSGIGLLLMFAALPLWGEYDANDHDKENRP